MSKSPVLIFAIGKCPVCHEDAMTVYRYEFPERTDFCIECSACPVEPSCWGITEGHALNVSYQKPHRSPRRHPRAPAHN